MKSLLGLPVTRRLILAGSALLGGAQAAGLALRGAAAQPHGGHAPPAGPASAAHGAHGGMMTVGEVDHVHNGFDPHAMLTDWDTGTVVQDPDGRPCREFDIVAEDKEIEIAPGIMFPAWTYNGRVPGPTIRVTEGERVRVRFHNRGSHAHSIHFHGIHSARMDGVPGAGDVLPGGAFTYEFTAFPFGCHLYHCHTVPLKRHIHKGLYGAFIIDPDPARHPEHEAAARSRLLGTDENRDWQEFMMVMNAFDTNFDEENEVYAANTVAHAYSKRPIVIDRSRPVRVYLVNVTEFDPINSFHLHGNFFDYYDHGTTLTPTLRTVDTVTQCQGQRGILEFSFRDHEAGLYMFHAHQSEFVELGWMSLFDVRESVA
ncbi:MULTISPECIES: multicopper oxidase domain-containing protein [Azospirillum]|uniref:Copper-containing nitrite reductase n=1 Tax=Azospirillum brasilense TaxID=192 RepID=A0A6L3B1C7_AZOBR|nr:multicopper oxidase domain-containing protein [Azospirillum brasilense]KAA0686122.1 copper oxidase [Azospirillum brasilense]